MVVFLPTAGELEEGGEGFRGAFVAVAFGDGEEEAEAFRSGIEGDEVGVVGVDPAVFGEVDDLFGESGGEGETEDGRAGAVMGWKDQCVRACASVMGTIFGADGAGAVMRGSGAPRWTHSVKMATSAALSASFGGIWRSSFLRLIAATSRLFAGSPGTMTAPVSPPACQPGWESRRRPPFCFLSLWHS